MPAMLYKGQNAQDVAAYVAAVAAMPGQDTGALATAGAATVPVTPGVGQDGVHRPRRLRLLPHARGRGHDRDGRAQPRPAAASDCATAAVQEDPRRDARASASTTAIINPYAYIPSGYAAGVMPNTFSQDAQPEPDQGAGGVPVERDEVGARAGARSRRLGRPRVTAR